MIGAKAQLRRGQEIGYKGSILLIVLLAFGLRLFAIDRQDIWGDEAFSIWLSRQPLPQVVAGGADTHPPLYPFLLYLWLPLAGSSPLAVRFLSALIGTLTVAMLYPLSRRVFGQTAGWPAVLLAAASPVLVYYPQETRMYGLVTLLTTASIYWAARVGRKGMLPYIFSTLTAVYTHYYAFFVVLAENLVIVPGLLRRHRWPALRRWLVAQGSIALAYVPWIAVQTGFLRGKAGTRFTEWDLSTALRIVGETVKAFSAGLALPSTAAWAIAALFLVAVLTGLLAVFVQTGWRLKSRLEGPLAGCLPARAGAPMQVAARLEAKMQLELAPVGARGGGGLIVACLLIPLALAWAVNPIMPFFYPRYLLLIAPVFYLLAAQGVSALGRLWRPLGVGGTALLLAGSAYGLYGYYTDDAYLKGRYGQMMAYVQAHARPGDALILANQLQRPLFQYYQPEGLDAYFFPRYGVPLEDPSTAAELEAIAARHPRLWLVRFGNPAEYDPNDTLTRWLATHGSKAYFDGWVDADLSLYVMTPTAGDQALYHPLRLDLGGHVALLGYALNTDRLAPGETLLLTLYWQTLVPMGRRYTVFTHLLDATNQIKGQMDSEPQGGGLPTNLWTAGQVIQDNYALTVDDDAVPGSYLLEVGMYLLETNERLPVYDPVSGEWVGDRVVLGTIEVVEP